MQELDSGEITATIDELHMKLDRLKTAYEQFFMGLEKREPQMQRKDVVRLIRLLESTSIRNTAQKFRFRTLVAKFNTYKTYWNRTLRAIEKGTYHRDVAKLRRKLANRGIELNPGKGKAVNTTDLERAMREAAEQERNAPRRSASEIRGRPAQDLRDAPMHLDEFEGLQPQAAAPGAEEWEHEERTNPSARSPLTPGGPYEHTPPPSSAPRPVRGDYDLPSGDLPSAPRMRARVAPPPPQHMRTPSSGASGGLPDAQMRSLYRRLIKAKKICGEDTNSVRYESLVKTINRQMPKLRQMHQGRDVEFQVVIRDGRAILKAKAK